MKRLHFFFLFIFFSPLISQCEEKIYNDLGWKALIHFYHGNTDIQDSKFFIGTKFINLEDEFEKTYNEIFIKKNIEILCRFPARYIFIQQKLNLPQINLKICKDLSEFIDKAPVEQASLVFASENISMPMSMMGHIFLKISGENINKIPVNHSISFFTDVDKVSFPKLVIQSLLTGMNGVYALAPYEAQKNNYLYFEQRNIWEYELKLDDYQLKILQYHLFELKEINFKYFFHIYNCATLINSVLSVPYSALGNERTNWVTPLDVVRSIYQLKLISKTSITPSSVWKIKSILESNNFDSEDIKLIQNSKIDQSTNLTFIKLELAKSYNDYLFESNIIDKNTWNLYDDKIKVIKINKFPNNYLETINIKSPTKTAQDSQVYLELLQNKSNYIYKIGFMPASHKLEDDNLQYTNESELKLGDVAFVYSNSNKSLKLDTVTLYSATALRPSDKLLGGISGKFEFGYGEKKSNELKSIHSYNIDSSIGKTYRIGRDLDTFLLLDFDLRLKKKLNVSTGPKAGFLLRELFNMKTIVTYNYLLSGINSFLLLNEINIIQSINFQDYSINLNAVKYSTKSNNLQSYAVVFKKIF